MGEDRSRKDLYIQLIDYSQPSQFRTPESSEVTTVVAEPPAAYHANNNIFKIVNQLEITGYEKRIPDGILYINGLPLVVFELKSAIREEATIHDAYVQLTVRYQRDIPELLKYNAICVISDGVNNKAELKVALILLLAENDYPPVDRDEVYKEIFEQAENFKRFQGP